MPFIGSMRVYVCAMRIYELTNRASIMLTHIINAFVPISSPICPCLYCQCVYAIHHPSSKSQNPSIRIYMNAPGELSSIYSHVWFSTIECCNVFVIPVVGSVQLPFAPLLPANSVAVAVCTGAAYILCIRSSFSLTRFCLFISYYINIFSVPYSIVIDIV